MGDTNNPLNEAMSRAETQSEQELTEHSGAELGACCLKGQGHTLCKDGLTESSCKAQESWGIKKVAA